MASSFVISSDERDLCLFLSFVFTAPIMNHHSDRTICLSAYAYCAYYPLWPSRSLPEHPARSIREAMGHSLKGSHAEVGRPVFAKLTSFMAVVQQHPPRALSWRVGTVWRLLGVAEGRLPFQDVGSNSEPFKCMALQPRSVNPMQRAASLG